MLYELRIRADREAKTEPASENVGLPDGDVDMEREGGSGARGGADGILRAVVSFGMESRLGGDACLDEIFEGGPMRVLGWR